MTRWWWDLSNEARVAIGIAIFTLIGFGCGVFAATGVHFAWGGESLMNVLARLVLVAILLIGAGVLLLGLMLAFNRLAWFLMREWLGWKNIRTALRFYAEHGPQEGGEG